jgi:hypothetical protein
MNKDNNYISVGSWMLMMLVLAIPCVGLIMIIVWALVGENETRKNYFRALIAWFVIITAIYIAIATFGFMPEIQKEVQTLLEKQR